jgi:hypothetical protein
VDNTKNQKLLEFTQELKKMDLYPGQFDAVMNVYKQLETSEINQISSNRQAKPLWKIEQTIGSILLFISSIMLTIFLFTLLPNNKLLIGGLILAIYGIIFLFGKNLVELLLAKLIHEN